MHAFIARHVLTISLLKTKTPFHSFILSFWTPPNIQPPTKCSFNLEKKKQKGIFRAHYNPRNVKVDFFKIKKKRKVDKYFGLISSPLIFFLLLPFFNTFIFVTIR
jgi:hypothetical protein